MTIVSMSSLPPSPLLQQQLLLLPHRVTKYVYKIQLNFWKMKIFMFFAKRIVALLLCMDILLFCLFIHKIYVGQKEEEEAIYMPSII